MTAPDSLPFAALLEENLASASPDLLRQMVKTFADAMMSADVDTACGASYGMPSEERVNSCLARRRADVLFAMLRDGIFYEPRPGQSPTSVSVWRHRDEEAGPASRAACSSAKRRSCDVPAASSLSA
ncbi:transposase [Streptomyces sp. NBC_00873]|uniref:hypothetical protein n=1 Tax=Streptomyces sp. NBC_00873 TaxID=2975852 RepID=UPI003869F16F|nr:transposase [Streptomyces sp. NBC_00873]